MTDHKYDYNTKGLIMHDLSNGLRAKIRNPVYEDVKNLRGNQPKLQYQYLSLRKYGKVYDYLQFYPEDLDEITKYRDQLHNYTSTLYNNYISCFIKKQKHLKEYPFQYKVHMYSLHQLYIHLLKPDNKYITMRRVINYINTLDVKQQMYFINYNDKHTKINNNNNKFFYNYNQLMLYNIYI